MSKELICSIWNDGSNGWGIRIGLSNRRYIDKSQTEIIVELNGKENQFNITDTFWTTCPEIRGKSIREWLQDSNINKQNKNDYAIILTKNNGKYKAEIRKK